ncbi:MAG: S-layer homology domain-containing protein [Gemmatimonadaceae bacterium]|nr:S-layer homology domain-containing protein [Gemmatimonadaceae bacterium]
MALSAMTGAVTAYPPADTGYLDYTEMVAEIRAIAGRKPSIARLFTIGRSHQGRELWAVKVSDNVRTDEDEPEVLFDAGMHAREHMTTEMAVALFRRLVDGYGTSSRLTDMVDANEITIIFNLNPDGSEYDHSSGTYRMWRKNRQPTPNTSSVGTDINRNFGYRWGTNTLNASPEGETYRGPAAWSTPEAAAFKRYVDGRVIGGEQQIRVHVTFHQYGRVVLYPYGYTTAAVPADMHPEDRDLLVAMATAMAERSRYGVAQSSSGSVNVGNQMDWLYATYRTMTFTFEMGDTFYMPDEAIPTETARNMEAAYFAIERAACPYAIVRGSDELCFANPFTDIGGSKFHDDILWIYDHGITVGCRSDRFCPDGLVTRAQMATFLTRALTLPAASRDYFSDDTGNKHEDRINRLAEAGITVGCGGTRFCPDGTVTREQMATFLVRAFRLPSSSRDYYADDEDSKHEERINALAASGITRGCGPSRFCPSGGVTRGQMAAFLHRALAR